jgi:hypothetical protein
MNRRALPAAVHADVFARGARVACLGRGQAAKWKKLGN